ncbi:MAG: UDP-N-acetylglucosamine--N-acetylmuramyl-(pentapeptide) pyrophosphoryl-undecaprenol N-acetylglucosamine transferase [Chlamydiales bacterium]|jgi:UDP-N-acetylglucosamine--N-acetylmuramyl-(pentapeptide) pyrophosphoryl-undecaprenol N-acetylglucosamine transferase
MFDTLQPTATVDRPLSKERSELRLAFAGGGSGGHIVPGLHLLDALDFDGRTVSDLVWFQSGRKVETRVMDGVARRLGGASYERVCLDIEPSGGGAPSVPRLAWRLTPEVWRARSALRRHRIDVVLGLGGFTTVPVVLAARSLRLPVALLEVNATAGRATKVLSPLADMVFHAWRSTMPAGDDDKHLYVGAPLGPAYLPDEARITDGGVSAPELDEHGRGRLKAEFGFAPDRPLLLILGGSQGAKPLNEFIGANETALLAAGVQILHQVGPGRSTEGAASIDGYRMLEYINDVPGALSAADMVLCRGGASTLAEIGALRTPAWVVPYPHHPDRHQERNARQLGDGVRIVDESELVASLAVELVQMLGPEGAQRRAAMREALRGTVPTDGSLQVWNGLFAMGRTLSRSD